MGGDFHTQTQFHADTEQIHDWTNGHMWNVSWLHDFVEPREAKNMTFMGVAAHGYVKPRIYPASFGYLLLHYIKYPTEEEYAAWLKNPQSEGRRKNYIGKEESFGRYGVFLMAHHLDLERARRGIRPHHSIAGEEWLIQDFKPYDGESKGW